MSDAISKLEHYIHKLVPFKDLPVGDRMKMAQTVQRIQKHIGDTIYASELNDHVIYLLSGKLELCRSYVPPELISSGSGESLKPLFREKEDEEVYLLIQSNCEILLFDRKLFNRLIEKEVIVDERDLSREMGHVENSIYNEIMHSVETGRLQLPSLPEIALRIKKAVEQSDVDIEHVSKIMELDPALSARLIKVANSALIRGANPIHSMRDVIVRLGLKVTHNLVMSFSVAQLFITEHALLKKQMKAFYAHSIEIAAISYAIGTHVRTLDADELLLAGLIHDIGVIPIITHIEKTGLEFSGEEEINSLIKSLRVAVGVMVVKSWDLPKEMFNVVSHAEHWHHDSGKEIKVEDVIIIAQIYDMLRRKQVASLPDIHKVPALKKLFPDKHDPVFAMQILDQAREEISEMKGLLGI